MAEIKGLKTLAGRTCYVGDDSRFPGGCRSCLTGTGLSAVRKTNRCNLNCPFCYNYGELDRIPPVGEGMWEIGGTKFRTQDIDLLLSIQKKPTGISYVYLEPFMEIEVYYPVIRTFRAAEVHQHLYTNGTLATPQTLRALGEAGAGRDPLQPWRIRVRGQGDRRHPHREGFYSRGGGGDPHDSCVLPRFHAEESGDSRNGGWISSTARSCT